MKPEVGQIYFIRKRGNFSRDTTNEFGFFNREYLTVVALISDYEISYTYEGSEHRRDVYSTLIHGKWNKALKDGALIPATELNKALL